MSKKIIYEQPLNERIRAFLRLEFLFERLDLALQSKASSQSRDVIEALLNILSVFERSDLKLEIIKEQERLISTLTALENMAGVDKQTLDNLLIELDHTLNLLHLNKPAIGQNLRENDFLYSIRQRSSILGGTCDFDLPAYHFWLQHTDPESQNKQLSEWVEQFSGARSAIEITLKLIRNSTGFSDHAATTGFYQHNLDSSQPTQLIRVQIPKDADYYPEISGGKHRFTVRFMHFDIGQRAKQVSEDVDFSLSCCAM